MDAKLERSTTILHFMWNTWHRVTVGNFQQIPLISHPNFTLNEYKRFRVYKISFPNTTRRVSFFTPSSFQHYFNGPSWSISISSSRNFSTTFQMNITLRKESNSSTVPILFQIFFIHWHSKIIISILDSLRKKNRNSIQTNRSNFTFNILLGQVSQENRNLGASWFLVTTGESIVDPRDYQTRPAWDSQF